MTAEDSYELLSFQMCSLAIHYGHRAMGFERVDVYVSTKPGEWIQAKTPHWGVTHGETIVRVELSAYEFDKLVGKGVL